MISTSSTNIPLSNQPLPINLKKELTDAIEVDSPQRFEELTATSEFSHLCPEELRSLLVICLKNYQTKWQHCLDWHTIPSSPNKLFLEKLISHPSISQIPKDLTLSTAIATFVKFFQDEVCHPAEREELITLAQKIP